MCSNPYLAFTNSMLMKMSTSIETPKYNSRIAMVAVKKLFQKYCHNDTISKVEVKTDLSQL